VTASFTREPCVRRLVLILGDQLTPGLGALQDVDPQRDHLLLAEVMEEASHVPHHPQKIALIFSAMRHFAEQLREQGLQVHYVTLDDVDNSGSLPGELLRWTQQLDPAEVHLTECGDWRLEQALRHCGVPIHWHADSRFLCSREAFADWAQGRKQLRMEYFYREMRRRNGLLLNPDGTPEGGAWNFDADNRKALPREVQPPARRALAMAVIENPYAGRYADNLDALIAIGEELGGLLGQRCVQALGIEPGQAQSYGKAAIVGEAGELEHAAALLHPKLGAPLRAAVEKGAALVPSSKKVGGLGTAIDVPLGHKDAAYVRSHFDAMEARVADAPRANEIVVAVAVTASGRPLARIGGLQVSDIQGVDGLR